MLEERRAAMARGEAYEQEARIRRADGEYRWVIRRVVPLRDEQDRSSGGMEPAPISRT